ncbi:MAG: hypothetical protein E6I58_00940 [Chloroflexi bacterium]|nr:MAG: hypothetical protein E6I58_00940 [Chloroflexota bacterium]
MEPEEDLRRPLSPARVGRALALMAASVLVIGITTIAYAHPQLPFGSGSQPRHASASTSHPSYRLAALDFVDVSRGWVIVELASHDFAVLHTADAGRSWTRQLSAPMSDVGEYARFFDALHGVVVLLGSSAVIFQTADAGKTWTRSDRAISGRSVLAADFVDPSQGWLLVQVEGNQAGPMHEVLYRTSDGGTSWDDLADPVAARDWAFRIAFADAKHGWLYSISTEPHIYATTDGGASWRRALLPAPPRGWPKAPTGSLAPELFFVAAHPTTGAGVAATVVPIAPPKLRSADGGIVLGYPPLTVRAFDGGGSVEYIYATFADSSLYRYTAILSEAGVLPVMPDQVELSSLDGGSSWKAAPVPSAYGAIGYADALDWWWVGAGAWATSSDGGVTWTGLRPLSVPAPLPGSLEVLDADHAWFGTMGSTTPLLQTTDDGGHEWRAVSLPPLGGS